MIGQILERINHVSAILRQISKIAGWLPFLASRLFMGMAYNRESHKENLSV
jgi:hypothetical protein